MSWARVKSRLNPISVAQDENTGCRLYSMSAQINAERDNYYNILERTQKGPGDITEWIVWFLECLERSIRRSDSEVQKTLNKARMWQNIAELGVNERQRKVINKFFEAGRGGFEGGLTNRK